MREHAILTKKIINLDRYGDRHIMCTWDDCERDGYQLFLCRVNYAKPGCAPEIVRYAFCSERHRQYWINSHHSYGTAATGERGRVL